MTSTHSTVPWYRFSAVVFAMWAGLFTTFPRFANEFGAVRYVPSTHAEDWTQLFGLFSLGFAVLLEGAHRSADRTAQRVTARGVLACTFPCALLTGYWQLMPDGRWNRLDLLSVALLLTISYGMFVNAGLLPRLEQPPPDRDDGER